MSNAVTRQVLADAASSVDRITCSPYFRQTTKPGDAMVRLDHIDYPNVLGGVVTWQVAIVLPQDIAQAEKFLDEKVPSVVQALAPEFIGGVNRVTPAQLVLDTGNVPVVFIEGQREE